MQNAGQDEAQAGIKNTREISITSDMQMKPVYGRKWRKTKQPLDESEKSGLKLNIQKTKFMSTGSITLQQIDGETMETVRDFIFFGS